VESELVLELDASGELYRGKLSHKPFHFREGAFVEEPYETDLEIAIAQLKSFKSFLAGGLLDQAENLVANEFVETANLSRPAEEDLSTEEFQRRLTLTHIEASEEDLYLTYYDGGECGGHYLTVTLDWLGEAVDFDMMG
jgi:hypothetical protein